LINNLFTERAAASVRRYGAFLEALRNQATAIMLSNPLAHSERQRARNSAYDAAKQFTGWEHTELTEDAQNVATSAYQQARDDLGLPRVDGIDARFEEFLFESANYAARLIAAQVDRDVVSMSQHILRQAQRIDLYVRGGTHTPVSAAAQIVMDDQQVPMFRFQDRLGRKFKSRKHIRDIYRAHLLNLYNEVYMDVIAEHGRSTAFITHPDPNYKWFGKEVAITPEAPGNLPLIYDIRDEVFHPSSNATLTINMENDDVSA